MKSTLLFLFFISLSVFSFGRTPNWLWAKSGRFNSLNGDGEGWSVATDLSGNIYATGWFNTAYVIFNNDTVFNNSTNSNISNIFIVKYDAAGNVVWAKSAGGNSSDEGFSVAVDDYGNIFLTGLFSSDSISFGNITLYNSFLSSSSPDIFLVKYNTFGNVLWAKSAGGSGSDNGNSLATDKKGNIFLCGNFGSPIISFGSYSLTNSSPPYQEIFVAKYDSSGGVLWAKSASGSNADEAKSLDVDSFGNVYITGDFSSNSITFGSYTLTGGAFYLAKYDSTGNVLWAKNIVGQAYGTAVVADNNGNAYVTGYYDIAMNFGSYPLSFSGVSDFFLVKYDSDGNILWAKGNGGNSADRGWGISIDSIANIYVAAEFLSSSIVLGSTTLTPPPGNCPPPYGCDPACIVKYDSSGNIICAFAIASGGDDNLGIAIDKSGNICFAGDFKSNPFILGIDTLPLTGGEEDIFVAKCKFQCDESFVEESTNSEKIIIYPNPNNGKFEVRGEKLDVKTIEIYNVFGECMHRQICKSANQQIDLSSQPNGIYFLHIKTEQGVASEKIIISR